MKRRSNSLGAQVHGECDKCSPMFIGICGSCEWYFASDNPKDAVKQMNDHLEMEHGGDENAATDMSLYRATEQVTLGLEKKLEIVLGRTR